MVSFGSVSFFTTLALLDAFEVVQKTMGILMAYIFSILALCWRYAIWNFVKISRIGEEIKYL